MKDKLPLIARILLGLIFFVFGIIGLLNVAPPPEDISPDMLAFFNGMMATKYMFPLVKGTEIVCGALLLANRFVPLALVILAPVVLNIFLVHAFMAPEGLVLAVIIGALEVYLAFFAKPYSGVVKGLFKN